ncbi:MAG: beta galactosidase jelly roll domain-containing protein, partial [Planctomycetota bacterium]
QRVTWLLLEAKLSGGTTLDYTNLSPLAWLEERMLVLSGPAGAEGLVSLDGAQVEVKVPTGKTPRVESVNGLTLVVLSTAMADASYAYPAVPADGDRVEADPGGWVVGSAGLDADGRPLPAKGWSTQFRIAVDGTATKHRTTVVRRPTAPRLEAWQTADVADHLDGSAPAYRSIPGPQAFEQLGNDFGYGWVHLELPGSASPTPAKTLAPGAADRLHVYRNGKFEKLITASPESPGALGPAPVSMRVGGAMTVLIDNLGRFNSGQRVGETKGLWSHLYAAKPVKLPAPRRLPQPSPDPYELQGWVFHQRRGDTRPAEGLVWTVKPTGRHPVVFELDKFPADAVLKVNGQPVAIWHHIASASFQRFLLDPADDGPFTGGQNEIELALFDPLPEGVRPAAHVRLHQTTANLTAKAKWSFAPWAGPPADDAFADPPAPASGKAKPLDQPTWYRTTFRVASTRCPLFFHPKGMSKGQFYLNGHNLGRYFIQTRDGEAVPPQSLYYLPEPWLNEDGDNVLTVFDEHGFPPTDARLAYEELGP